MGARVYGEIRRYSALWPVPLFIEVISLKLLSMTAKTSSRSRYMSASLNARCIAWNPGAELMNRLSISQLQFTKQVDSSKAKS